MSFFENTSYFGHESVHHFFEPKTGLKAIIAVHSTALGPAAGVIADTMAEAPVTDTKR